MKVLYLDIETAPMRVDAWGLWQQNIGLSQIIEDPRVICFAAKWRGVRGVHFSSEWQHGRAEMLGTAHELMSEADVIVHYNGERFDAPWLRGEFAREGMKPPAPFRQLDLMKVIKRTFRFPSNKLAYVTGALGVPGKVHHEGHALWVKCLQGDPAAQRKMERYNRQDTSLLEDLHNRILPWITNHPSVALMSGDTDTDRCPNCGSEDLRREGRAFTQLGAFQRYQCRDCGAWSRSGKRIDHVDLRGVAA